MEYRRHPAPQDLAAWVECAWTLRGTLPACGQSILPDGRFELIFHFGETPTVAGTGQPAALLAGRITRSLELERRGRMDALGIRLRPGAAHAMLPCGAGGPIEDLEGILGSWARQARERIGNSARPLALVWELLRERLRKAARPDAAIVDCIASIERARGAGAMDRFRPAGLSLRQWQRRFLDSTGFTPKSFARIVRLQGVLANHEANPRRPWSELALDAGYFDQSHLIPEFRSFTGSSPERFFAARPALEDFYLDFPDDAFLQDAHWR